MIEEKNIYKVDHFMVKTLMQNIGSYKYVVEQ
jgi:glucose-6-phosphate 1-dehydrogenase